MKEVLEILESLEPYTPESDAHKELCASKQAILERCFTEDAKKEEPAKEEQKLPWQGSEASRPCIYAEVFDKE